MRLAFATILGGMTTLIGTPPNLIVSGFMKAGEVGQDFAMFDFTPVGGAVAVSGLAFMALIGWRLRYGVSLLAISREGGRSIQRLPSAPLAGGDVLLLQGRDDAIASLAGDLGLVPLAERNLRIRNKREAIMASALMLAAIAGAAFGLVPSAVAFALGALGALAMMALRIVDPDAAYRAVDWPVVVLLGAMMPVAGAIESTGLARVIATGLIDTLAQGHAVLALTMILVVTMTLSDFMNNAATTAVMCPIALAAAGQLDAQPQSFLMAVAIGASCAFLTPIGHQNNTPILDPGGLKFGDHWRLGLSLEIVVVLVAVPMLLWVWPL